MPLGQKSTFLLIDRLLDGHLADFINERRTNGLSFTDIAFELRTQHDVRVSGETVRNWMKEIAADAKVAEAKAS